MNQQNRVMVKSEFAPLKRVVLTQSEFIFPAKPVFGKEIEILTAENIELYKDAGGKNYRDAFPERQRQWETERANLETVLKKYGVAIIRPRLLTGYEKDTATEYGCSNFFVRDPFFTIGNCIIEGSMRYFYRRYEIMPVRKVLENVAYFGDALYVAVPHADCSQGPDSEQGPFLEGGDILVLDKTVFVGNSGQASNHNGYLWLKCFLAHLGYEVVEVPLRRDVLHLDCALSLVRNRLMIVCEEALLEGIPAQLQDWEKIVVPYQEVAHLALNGLPVNETVYITDPAFEDIGKQLNAYGITVEYIDFTISRSLGGSFRCSTQPLHRE